MGLACGGTIVDVLVEPSLDPVVERAAHELGYAVITPLPADSPGPAFGPHEPGERFRGARRQAGRRRGGALLQGTTGDATLDADLRAAASDVLERGRSWTVEAGGRRSWFVEAFASRGWSS
ncbi:MAG: hypothetical protein U0667_17830 [Chloroflexota bacterium]